MTYQTDLKTIEQNLRDLLNIGPDENAQPDAFLIAGYGVRRAESQCSSGRAFSAP